jgi:hypothetical protein
MNVFDMMAKQVKDDEAQSQRADDALAACAAILALPFESMEQLTQFPAGDHERGYNEALAEVRAILAQHGITKDS